MSALQAIRLSQQQDEIVHVSAGGPIALDLFMECDGCTEAGEDSRGRRITEYWGEDWRVHVHTPKGE